MPEPIPSNSSLTNATPTSDSVATIASLREIARKFVLDRDWEKFHTPKNLASAVAIEAAELMEHFQWLTPEESADAKECPEKKAAIAEELCDVLAYLLSMANAMEIDVASSFVAKMAKNSQKYPV